MKGELSLTNLFLKSKSHWLAMPEELRSMSPDVPHLIHRKTRIYSLSCDIRSKLKEHPDTNKLKLKLDAFFGYC